MATSSQICESVFGKSALYYNTTGCRNTASGAWSLADSDGNNSKAVGYHALASSITGGGNVAVGFEALRSRQRTMMAKKDQAVATLQDRMLQLELALTEIRRQQQPDMRVSAAH